MATLQPRKKVQNGWTETSRRERHFRIEGRIEGKIISFPPKFDCWRCRLSPLGIPSFDVGERASEEEARRLLEMEVRLYRLEERIALLENVTL
jgi:hypothetical protein